MVALFVGQDAEAVGHGRVLRSRPLHHVSRTGEYVAP
jgi:hypothetical protein